jgi:hypothetical protein
MKLVLSSLLFILGLLFPSAAFAAWDENARVPADDGTYYEMVYTQCAFKYASSSYSENEIECLCGQVADNALRHRGQASEKLPPVPESEAARCLYSR